MIKFLFLFILMSSVFAGLLDFIDLNKAKEAYLAKNYQQAQNLYQNFQNDFAKLNTANALYKQKKYKKAIDLYKAIKHKNLIFDKLHNLGNAYAQLKQTDTAIDTYKKALQIKKDQDTQYNLKLLQQQKKKEQKDNKNKENSKQKKKKEKQQQQKKNKESKEKKKEQNKKKEKQQQQQKDKENKENSKQNKQSQQQKISKKMQKKWQKILNKRGIKTLMIPLNNNNLNNENITNPW